MARVDVDVSNFTPPSRVANRSLGLNISLAELAWGVITVGAPNALVALRNILSGWAFTGHKVLALLATLESDGRRFVHPPNYRSLDQSEKVSLSYWLGMGMAKVVAGNVLNIAWLSHARFLERQGTLQIVRPARSRMLPDLIGHDNTGAWHVVEAKARQSGASPAVRQHWKAQAGVVRNVNGAAAVSRSYCLTLQDPVVRVELVDPEPEADSMDLEIDAEALIQKYYLPYRELFRDSEGRRDGEYVFAPFVHDIVTGEELSVGLPQWVVISRFDRLPEEPVDPRLSEDGKTYFGPDHIAVHLAGMTQSEDSHSDDRHQ